MQVKKENQTAFSKDYLIKNTGITSFCRALGVASGMILDAIILAYFGLGNETDAFFAALAIPFLITATLEIQAPKVLVPVFATSLKEDGEKATWYLLRNFLTASAIVLFCTSLLATLSAGILMPPQVPGFGTEVAKLSVRLSMILCWLVFVRGVAAILQSILYVYHQYLVPSSTRFVSNTVAILVVIFSYRQLGICAVAYGLLLGSIVQVVILMFAVRSNDFKYEFICRLKDPKLQRIFKLLVYPLAGHGVSEARLLVQNFLASFLGGGSLSALRYALRIVQALSGVLVGSIVTTSLPLVSHYAALKNIREVKRSLLRGIKLLTLIALPLSVWLIFTGNPLLILLFERGEFSRADAALTSSIIALMVPYILLSRIAGITQTPFYATMDMKTPFLGAVLSFLAYVAVASLLLRIIGIYAFPIALSSASLSTAIFMVEILRRKFGSLGWKELKDFGLRLSATTLLIAFSLILGLHINTHFIPDCLVNKLLAVFIPTTLGFVTFLVVSILLRLIQWHHVRNIIFNFSNSIALPS